MTSALAFRGIHKTYHAKGLRVHALAGVDLEIPELEFTAIVGPSGCGKSTLLNIAAGLDSQIDGEVLASGGTHRIGSLFQTPRLLPWLTAEQNVAFVLGAHGVATSDGLAMARRYLRLVGLAGFEGRYPGQLSGGMQQRVSLARALAVEPTLLLMDEPFASLDELTARRMREELLRLFMEMPRTVLFVTHNVTEAVFLADTVVVMTSRPGRVQAAVRVDLPRPREYDDLQIAVVAREIMRYLNVGYRDPVGVS